MELSRAEYADKIGMKSYQIRDMERGRTDPSVEMLVSVIEKFDVDTEWLLGGTANRVAETGMEYVTGEKHGQDATCVRQRIAWHCGNCLTEIAKKAERCHKCGARLDWTQVNKKSAADPARTGSA